MVNQKHNYNGISQFKDSFSADLWRVVSALTSTERITFESSFMRCPGLMLSGISKACSVTSCIQRQKKRYLIHFFQIKPEVIQNKSTGGKKKIKGGTPD